MSSLVTLTQHGAVAVVALDNPPVNALSHALRSALSETLARAFSDASIRAVVIWCEGRTFVAGADIREFGMTPLSPDVPEVIEFIASAEKPVVAALHGTALGGGLELALACHFRVAVASAKVGLPEVTLGLLPGAGGTQRLPRLVGVGAALDLIVNGTLISASKAHAIGLVDAIVEDPLREHATAFAERVSAEQRPLRRASELGAALDVPGQLEAFEAAVARKNRGFLAPFRCIEAIRAAVELPFRAGLARERELFVELMASPQSKAQRHAFFAEREVTKPPASDAASARKVQSVAVVGDGTRARAIAAWFAEARLAVTLRAASDDDGDQEAAADPVNDADLVIEAMADRLTARRSDLVRVAAVAKPGAILATTVACADIDVVAACTRRPQDVIGMHFHGATTPRVIENVRARDTAPEVSAAAMQLGKMLGKIPVLVRGPVGSRMFSEYLREALFLLEEGALPEQVDRVLYDFGFEMGPFARSDESGLDIEWQHRKVRFDSLDPRARACNLLDRICEQGRFGVKAGAGFYRYDASGNATPDPAIEALLALHSSERGIQRRAISDREILDRCLFALINEGATVLEEGLAHRPLEIDVIWMHGYSFPVYRGGPMYYADQLGLAGLQQAVIGYRGPGHRTAASLVTRLIREGKGFYAAP